MDILAFYLAYLISEDTSSEFVGIKYPIRVLIIIIFFIKLLYIMKKINKIKIKINGKFINIQDKITLFNLIKKLKVPIKKVAIELNQTIVNKRSFNKIKIKKNDKIEIVHFIGGG